MTRLGILGPVMAWTDAGAPVRLGGPKDRATLTFLALSANRACSESEVVAATLGDDPPDTAANLVQNQVFRLRKALRAAGEIGPSILSRPGGYELATDPEHLDVLEVERLLTQGREAQRRRDHAMAGDRFGEALRCWRGRALADLGDPPFLLGALARLEELRLSTLEARLDADLACGRHAELLGELDAATAAEPLRERLWGQRMLALYRCGRLAEALRAYQEVRCYLGEEVGLEPGPALAALERSIARSDAQLDWHPPDLPSGTVTFLRSDIERATQLFHRLGGSYASVLEDHDRLIRGAVAPHAGVEVNHEGDSFLFAFHEAPEAVSAALDVQVAIGRHLWPAPVRVRLGVHTGEAMPSGAEYIALPVHQVVRLSDAAHGGQVLLGRSTVQSAGRLPEGATLIDLGPHQLRDFPTAEPVWQLAHPDLTARFPPLRSQAIIRHNIPRPRSRFVGHSTTLDEVVRLLGETGVVSIVGPGGVGKTRLAVEVATIALARFPAGAWLVELGPLADGHLVPEAIAAALGAAELPGRPVLDGVIEHLSGREALIVLDNCEHLIGPVAGAASAIARSCPGISVLTTSREALRIDGEVVWRLAPLRAPAPGDADDVESLAAFEAVELFCDRATLASPGFGLTPASAPRIAAITGRLDGIPLALELAAARLVDLDLATLEAGLADRFALLASGQRTAPARQQTLSAAIAWSYDLLDDAHRALLTGLAPFAGQFDIAAVAAVTDLPLGSATAGLERLVACSLVDVVDGRYRLLETIRAYATERLDELAGRHEVRARHLAEFTTRAEAAGPHLLAPDLDRLTALEGDADNLREALRWGTVEDPVTAVRLATAMFRMWDYRGHRAEGLSWLEAALHKAGSRLDDTLRARALYALGWMTMSSDGDRSRAYCHEAAALFRAQGSYAALARALCGLVQIAWEMGDLTEADVLVAEALDAARRAGDPVVLALVLNRRSMLAVSRRRYAEATRALEEIIPIWRSAGHGQELIWTVAELGHVALRVGDLGAASARIAEALDLAVRLQYAAGEAWVRCLLGIERHLAGDLTGARRELSTAATQFREMDDWANCPWALLALARVALAGGGRAEAHALLAEAGEMIVRRGGQVHGICLHLALLAAACDEAELSAELLGLRAVLPEHEPPLPCDPADMSWAEALARDRLGGEAFERSFQAGARAQPYGLVAEASGRIDPERSTAAGLPPDWRGAGGLATSL